MTKMETLKSFCRICLEDKSDIYSVFDVEQNKYLPAIIFNISGVKIIRKNEPNAKICSNCKKAVLIAESIILRCQETEEYLQNQPILYRNEGNLISHETLNESLEDEDSSAYIQCEETSTPEPLSSNNIKISALIQCDQCEFNTKTAKVLVQHRIIEHNIDDPNIFSCPTCGERFSRKLELRRHIQNIHKMLPEEKKFLCNECGKTYIMEKHLLEHHKDAHEPSRFKCVEPNCHQSFKRAFSLRRHYHSMHDTKSRFSCDMCDLHFKIYDQWRYHNRVVHKRATKSNLDGK